MQVNYAAILPNSFASERDDSKLATSLAAWLSIRDDLERVTALAHRIGEILRSDSALDQLILESMTWHLVLRYARCFDSSATGRPTVLGADVVAKLDSDSAAAHAGLMHRRNNTFAHAGRDCSCHLNVHLVDLQGELRLQPTFDEEAPGPLNDSDQVDAIVGLCGSLSEMVTAKIEKASLAYADHLAKNEGEIVGRLRANPGRHANLSQQAFALMSKLKV